MKRVGRIVLAAVVFGALLVGFLAWLFPADAVARALLGRLPPGWPAVVFRSARLGMDGLELLDATLRAPDGQALLASPRIAFRPSLAGLWSRAGLPWRIVGQVCDGEGEAIVSGDRRPAALTLAWHDVDLAACPPLAMTGSALAGRAVAVARLGLEPAATGDGTVEVRGGAWRSDAETLAGLGTLHAERALVRWRLVAGRLELTALELHGPEVSAEGTGRIRLTAPLDASALDLRLAVSPAPDAPDRVRALLALLPGANVTVGGTLARPALIRDPMGRR